MTPQERRQRGYTLDPNVEPITFEPGSAAERRQDARDRAQAVSRRTRYEVWVVVAIVIIGIALVLIGGSSGVIDPRMT
jgi:hypothetical protein